MRPNPADRTTLPYLVLTLVIIRKEICILNYNGIWAFDMACKRFQGPIKMRYLFFLLTCKASARVYMDTIQSSVAQKPDSLFPCLKQFISCSKFVMRKKRENPNQNKAVW